MIPSAAADFIATQGWGPVTASAPVAGGCINAGQVLATAAGPPLFLKLNPAAPPGMFAREADGLAALAAVPGAPRVPAPILSGADFLLLEYLAPSPPGPRAAARLGEQLAALHAAPASRFGFHHDNYLGSTPQPNTWTEDGWAFFAQHRLLHQGRLARQSGLLSPAALRRLEALAQRLPGLIPHQPPSLLHGDLWSGNIIPGPRGQSCLIDPAAHYGWAEADLAMTVLFGRQPDAFYAAYAAAHPLSPGFPQRQDLYNLYHLLNHLNLFGPSYLASVESILSRYA
jgi:fructosamine-3-kinase